MKQKYLMKIFLLLSSVFSFAQTTYDFTTDATLSGAGGGWPWNTTADITIGGVAYRMTSGGNGSFSNVGSGGESNSKALRKDGAGGDSFTLQRADGQPFQFYGIWVNMQGLNSYSTIPGITLPPWYTLTAGSFTYQDMTPMTAGTAWNNYTHSSTSISSGAGGVNVTSVSINFPGINYYVIDNIVVGTAVVLNDPPTNIALSASSINENVAANSTIGTLSTTDPNSGNTFTYTLVSGTGDTHNNAFNISGNNLRITNSPNFETQANYSIRVRTTDQGGLTYEKSFAITINNQNETPTDIALTANSIDENVLANTPVGVFSSTDVDAANTFTYTLVAGTGSTDNASFNISGNSLRITNSPDFETKSSYAIRVRTTDQGSLFFEKQFTITINNLNEAPTDISLSATAINENVAANSTVGTLSSSDVDAANTFTYTLVAGTGSTDNTSFNISGNSLRITNSPDFETKSSYAIRVRTTDQGSLFFEKQFTITINNLTETPATHLDFDGVNDVVNCGTTLNAVIDPLNTITVEAWVKPSTNTGLGVIIGNYANSNQSSMQFLLRRDNNNYAFWVSGNPGVFKVVNATNAVAINTWQHVAGVWNGSDLKIYVNGVLMATTTGVTESSFATTTNTTMIGNNQAGTGAERFTGSIDEVRIWNFARTIEQINGSKNCELQGSESGLITYYNFNQGIDAGNNAGVTTLNAVTGPNGTLTSFTLNGTTSNWLAGSPVTTGSIVPSVATVTTPVVYTQGDTATPLTATIGANGTGLSWYTSATGGTDSTTAPTPSTTTVGSTSYWVSSINANGCESPRTEVVVTVNALVPATHLNFDGTNDFVVSANAVTNNTQNQTYQAWFRIPSIPANNDRILQRGNDGTGGWSVQIDVNAAGRLSAAISATPDTFITGTTVLTPNTWYHATFVFENNNSLRLYLNGNLEASIAIGNRTLRNSDNRLRIGTGNLASEHFNGDIDEVRVWNKVLNPTDILNTMNCELQATETGLVAYYKFNQGNDGVNNSTVNSLLDSSSNANNGTLTGFALTGPTSNWRLGSTITTGNTCTTLGNSDFENSLNITIYPNPSTGIFNIVSQESISLGIYDLLGKLIYNQSLANGTNSIDISNFNTGVYLLRVTDDNGNIESHKLIKN